MRPTALAALLLILAALAWLAFSAPPQDSNGTTGSTPEATQESNPANAATASSSAATHENGEGEREKVAPTPQAQLPATVRLQMLNQQNEPVANAFAVMGHLGTFRSHFGETNSANSPLEPKHLAESTGDISITLDPERHSRALVIGGENWVPIEIEIDLLTSGEQRDLGVFHLTPGLRAHGVVLTPHGEPVVGAEVFLQEQGNNPFGSRFGGEGGRKTLSDEQGTWAFLGLQPGSWAVEVRAAGYVTHHGDSFSLRHATTSPEQTIQLDAGATFTGRVLDEQGAPIAGAKLLAYSSQKSQQGLVFGGEWAESPTFEQVMESSVTTDAAGKFVMAGLSGTGSDALAAAAPHYSLQTLDPLVPSGEILLHLDPCFTLQGKVVDLAGQPVPAIEVQLHNQDNKVQAWGIPPERVDTDGHGHFSFDRVEQGEYRVVVDCAVGEGELKVEVDQQPDELLLPIGGEPNLTLTLTDQNGTPLEGAHVFARQDSDGSSVLLSPVSNPAELEHLKQMRGNWSQRSKTNDQGIALLRGAKGALHLSLSAAGYADKSVKLDMGQGEPQAHNYQMMAGGHLRVLVVDANQSPVARTPLQILREDDQESSYTESPYPPSKTTDATGRATFQNVLPGTYRIMTKDSEHLDFIPFELPTSEPSNPHEEDAGAMVRATVLARETVEATLELKSLAMAHITILVNGAPQAGALVDIQPTNDGSPMHHRFNLSSFRGETRRTNGIGVLQWSPLSAGMYDIQVRARPDAPITKETHELLPGVNELAISLASGRLVGTVQSNQGPVAGAKVQLRPKIDADDDFDSSITHSSGIVRVTTISSNGRTSAQSMDWTPGAATAISDASGRWEFDHVPKGFFTIAVEAGNHVPFESTLLQHDGISLKDLGPQLLTAGASLLGRLTGLSSSGEEIFGFYGFVNLTFKDDPMQSPHFGMLNSKGHFVFEGLIPGTYSLRLDGHPSNSGWTSGEFQIREGENSQEWAVP